MRKIVWILCVCLLFAGFSGCGQDSAYVPTGDGLADYTQQTQAYNVTAPGALQEESQPYSIAYYAEDGFNPYLCENYTNRLAFSLIYQGLFAVDKDYNVEPVLCKSYTVSEDMKTYTFRLESATFSDGSYLSAEDVVASLEAAEDSDYYTGRFDHVARISSESTNTVTITMDCAFENLPLLLDIPIVKKEQVGDEAPLGTGPYHLVNTAGGLALQQRSNWWCSAQLPTSTKSIQMWAAQSPAQIRDRFEFEDLGIAYTDPGAASYVDYRCDYEVWDCETGIFLYLGCNTESSVFSNDEVRAALTYAIDRGRLLEECYNGFGQTATLPASPSSPYYDKGLASQVTFEPERLRQALSNQGMIGKKVVLLVNKSDSVRLQAARLIGEMLTECGLEVEIQDNSTRYYREELLTDNYDLYLGQTKLSANMDLSAFFAPYGALSHGDMDDAACYSMCLEALENSGNYYNLYQMILKDGQLTPILFRTYAVYAERGLMSGLSPSRDNVFWYSLGKTMNDAYAIE